MRLTVCLNVVIGAKWQEEAGHKWC